MGRRPADSRVLLVTGCSTGIGHPVAKVLQDVMAAGNRSCRQGPCLTPGASWCQYCTPEAR